MINSMLKMSMQSGDTYGKLAKSIEEHYGKPLIEVVCQNVTTSNKIELAFNILANKIEDQNPGVSETNFNQLVQFKSLLDDIANMTEDQYKTLYFIDKKYLDSIAKLCEL